MISLQPLTGRWLKTNDAPQWIRALDVRDDGGRLRVRVHGDAAPDDWGESEADEVYALSPDSHDAAAFVARFTLSEHEVDLEANVNLGLLVVAAFTRGTSNQFTREFFYRPTANSQRSTANTWNNTNPQGHVMRLIVGVDTLTIPDWGTVPLERYEPDHAFSARFDDFRVQANVKGGVLVVAYFGRGIFRREFYWRSNGAPASSPAGPQASSPARGGETPPGQPPGRRRSGGRS
ncbi:MAG: hypothetical protein AABO58_05875 [Acidobacteriota bacterium]